MIELNFYPIPFAQITNHRLFSIAASIYQNDLKDKIEAEDIGTTPEDIENGITRRRQYRNIETVSYTHLDVYKRQGVFTAMSLSIKPALCSTIILPV